MHPSFNKFKFVLVLLLGFSLMAGGFKVYDAWASGENDYSIVYQTPFLKMNPGDTRFVSVVVQNTSPITWENEALKLGTLYSTGDIDRPSIWNDKTWESPYRILTSNYQNVTPFGRAGFHFTITAPQTPGLYKEYFMPVLEGETWLSGEPISLTMQVGNVDDLQIQDIYEKEVRINRDTQTGNLLESGFIVASLPVSTGMSGYTTPAGEFKIFNHVEEAYSQVYELYMGHWMGLTSPRYGFRGYGIHSLAYWKTSTQLYPDGTVKDGRLYTGNRVYEDVNHLGTPRSHGCIRFGIREAEILFDWANNGTPVTVV